MTIRRIEMSDKARMLWAFAITSIALFMTTLDNLVVTTALPVIRHDLHASLQGLEWTVNAYTLTFGLILIPLALVRLQETHGSNRRLDLPGLVLSAGGLFAIVWGLVRGNQAGWASAEIVSSIAVGVVVLALFVLWELRTEAPMLPMRFFRNITFTAANVASLFMFFGMFGSIFLLAQYFQTVQGSSPLQSGLRILPWTAMPIFIAPIAGLLSDRIGGRPIMAAGLALQAAGLARIAAILTTTLPYSSIVFPFALSGIGMAMYFAPVANVVLSSVKPEEEGQASGANNAIRELGGVFGVAVLAAVFSHYGGYQTPDSFVQGVTPALYLGAVIVAIGAAAALFIPRRRKIEAEVPQVERSGRVTRRLPLAVGVVLVSAIVVSAAAAATTTASTREAAAEPVLHIPAPTGAYPVGTRSIELVDHSRREPGT